MAVPQSLGNATTSTPRTFAPSQGQSIEYTEHRGQGAPCQSLGVLGDIYLDIKTPALFARCDAGWTPWPGPQVRVSALSHPVCPDHFLWASPGQGRVLWAPKAKMNKLMDPAMEVLKQVIAVDRRRDSKNLKRKAGEGPAGGDVKKARVSDVVTSSATVVEQKPAAQPSTSQTVSSPPPSADPIPRPKPVPRFKLKPSAAGVSKAENVTKPPIPAPTTTSPPTTSASKPLTPSVSKPPTPSTSKPSTTTTPVSAPPPRIASKPPTSSVSEPSAPSISTATSVRKPSTTTTVSKLPTPSTSTPSTATSVRKPSMTVSKPPTPSTSTPSTATSESHPHRVQMTVAKEMEPVQNELDQFKSVTPPEKARPERRRLLGIVGRHIEQVVVRKGNERERWRPLLWEYASSFWHVKTDGPSLEQGYGKLLAREAADAVKAASGSGSGSAATTPAKNTPQPPLPSASASSTPSLPKSPPVSQLVPNGGPTKPAAPKALHLPASAVPLQPKASVASGASKPSSKSAPKPAASAPLSLPLSISAPPSASSGASTSKVASSKNVPAKPVPRPPAPASSSVPSVSQTPQAPNPSSASGPFVTPTRPATDSVFAGILTLIQSNAKTLNSSSAKAAPPSPSPAGRGTVSAPPARTRSPSSAESQATLASPVSDRAGRVRDERADGARSRRQSTPSRNRADLTTSASPNSAPPRPPSSLLPRRESPRRLPGSKAASERLKEEEAAIVRLRTQQARCRSDAAAHRQGNAHWEAESTVSAALIEALTAAHAARKLESESLREENARLKGVNRLQGVLQRLDPEYQVGRKEETRVNMDEGVRVGDIVSRKQMVPDGDGDERARSDLPQSLDPQHEFGRKEEIAGDVVSDGVESGQREEQMVLDGDVDERARRGDSVPGTRSGDNVSGVIEPDQRGEQMAVEEDVVPPPSTKVFVKQEPPTSIPLINKPPVNSSHPEIIDLTLDSDDEDAAPPRPLKPSVASVPAPPISPVEESEPQAPGDRPVPVDLPMDTDLLDAVPDPSTPLHRQDAADPDPGASSGEQERPPSASASPPTPTLVNPSAAGYFRIVGTDFDYSDEHLLKIVLRTNGVNDNPRDGDWSTILAQLQITSPPSTDTFELGRWYKTADALRDYYVGYLAPPRSALTQDVDMEGPGGPEPQNSFMPSGIPAAVADVASWGSEDIGIDRFTPPPDAAPLLDPAVCRNTVLQEKDKNVRQLNEPQLQLVFPYHDGDPEHACSWCAELPSQRATIYPLGTSLEELSAHVEDVHPVPFERLLAETQGLDRDGVEAWFEKLDEDEEGEE
ncbi:hypothetical protein B0H16DRAFT_1541292 [Mycena metata]|uniref:Chromodomain-helicase-DNA-binding protein 1-like C-terminal domain-containing protein n=1 Tax=Mycena metata TaxID=1033252 RepID=A0AAD7J3P0_9AGAR|nr:hypothetical protein B0H16DRAFT_1541292 [Mycena metata]